MGYKITPRLRIDLDDLGDNQGTPFFVEIKNPRMLTYERKIELGEVGRITDETERAMGMKEVARGFIVSWNLLDMETEEPLDPRNKDSLERVPSEVVEKIFKSFGKPSEEAKNSSEQSDKS